MEKIILYYKFIPVPDPITVMHWQRELCERHGLKGRIIIAPHGINGTVGGPIDSVKAYVKAMNLHPLFKKISYKWSEGGTADFPRLSIKVRPELVAFGKPEEVKVDKYGVVGGGKHLKPEQLHKLLAERGQDVVFFDGRNKYEAEIGRFKNAVVPDVENTRDFITEIEDSKYDAIKDKPIVTYCTGGIRCEVLSSLMLKRGFKEVYQVEGGIVKYGETFKDDGEWEGKLYVFDKRMKTGFSDKAKDIGRCVHCRTATSEHINCGNLSCNKLVLVCSSCVANTQYCPQHTTITV